MRNIIRSVLAAVILAALLPATSGLAQMGPPPDPFLECYEFLDTNWVSDFGYLPLNCTNLVSVSVEEENALMLDTTNLEPAFLQYNVVETNGHTNLDFGAGAVSALVISDWASADTNQNGQAQRTGSQIGNGFIRQNQKAVVVDDQRQTPSALLLAPANPAVPRAQPARGRTKNQDAQPMAARVEDGVEKLLTHKRGHRPGNGVGPGSGGRGPCL